LSYFRFARAIADAMVEGFFDSSEGGFFDTRDADTGDATTALGILGTKRKPFQDSPTPAGNSAAAIALLRLHEYAQASSSSTHQPNHPPKGQSNLAANPDLSYRDQAERTLEVYAAVAGKHGIFAATYGLAVVRLVHPHRQIVVIGKDEAAAEFYRAAVRALDLNTSVLRLDADQAVAQNLPPALAETIPNLPELGGGSRAEKRSFAVVCSGFSCQPPIFDVKGLARVLGSEKRPAA
jgi:uncharacterized protein YyaL (SSP411 family)